MTVLERVTAATSVDPYPEAMRIGFKIGPLIVGSSGWRRGPVMRSLPRNRQGKIPRPAFIGAVIVWTLIGIAMIWFLVAVFSQPTA